MKNKGCKHLNILGIKIFYGWCSVFSGNYYKTPEGRIAPSLVVKKICFFKKGNGDYKYCFVIDYKLE